MFHVMFHFSSRKQEVVWLNLNMDMTKQDFLKNSEQGPMSIKTDESGFNYCYGLIVYMQV